MCYPESHSSIIASTSLPTSPLPTSAPELVAATSVEGSLKASSHEDKDALDLPPVDCASRETAMAIVDVLPQLLPLPSVTDTATASPSQKESDAEQARDSHDDTV